MADKAYAGKVKYSALRQRHRDAICEKPHTILRCAPLGHAPNTPIAKHRFQIAQGFGAMRCLFNLHLAPRPIFGLAKTHARLGDGCGRAEPARGGEHDHTQYANPHNRFAGPNLNFPFARETAISLAFVTTGFSGHVSCKGL